MKMENKELSLEKDCIRKLAKMMAKSSHGGQFKLKNMKLKLACLKENGETYRIPMLNLLHNYLEFIFV